MNFVNHAHAQSIQVKAHAHIHDHSQSKDKKSKVSSKIMGAGIAGSLELCLFHPLDTIAKRLMTSTSKYIVAGSTLTNVNHIIFTTAHDQGAFTKIQSLFPGVGYAMVYKVLQRIYKFGGQPIVAEALSKNCGGAFSRTFGESNGKSMMQATAGSIVGVGEIFLLPFDVLKIKAQTCTNKEEMKPANLWRSIKQNPKDLWKGAGFTAMRNAPGSFALFGANAYVKRSILKVSDNSAPSFGAHLLGSTAGACSSIIVAQPFDVIKTRLQKSSFGSGRSEGGISVMSSLFRNEGPTALFKGLTPKLIVVAPKLIFSFTIAQTLIDYFDGRKR